MNCRNIAAGLLLLVLSLACAPESKAQGLYGYGGFPYNNVSAQASCGSNPVAYGGVYGNGFAGNPYVANGYAPYGYGGYGYAGYGDPYGYQRQRRRNRTRNIVLGVAAIAAIAALSRR